MISAAVDCMDRLLRDIIKCKDSLLYTVSTGRKVILLVETSGDVYKRQDISVKNWKIK